jgi:hypothetical protein
VSGYGGQSFARDTSATIPGMAPAHVWLE